MIEKMTSKDLMDVLETSKDKIDNLKQDLKNTKRNINSYLSVVANAQEFSLMQFEHLLNSNTNANKDSTTKVNILTQNEELGGLYSVFASYVTPKLIKKVSDVFNIETENGIIFKNNVNIAINNITNPSYLTMLDSSKKENGVPIFSEFNDETIKYEIELDKDNLLGGTKFNTIELIPHIPGSYKIERIDIFTLQDMKKQELITPSFSFTPKDKAIGAMQFIMPNPLELYKCVIYVKVLFKNNNQKYPFGFKKIKFLNNIYNLNSTVDFAITSDSFIDSISEEIIIETQDGKIQSTCKEENIELYMSKINGQLMDRITTSKGLLQYSIPKNISKFYVKMPVKKSIYSLKFKQINKR